MKKKVKRTAPRRKQTQLFKKKFLPFIILGIILVSIPLTVFLALRQQHSNNFAADETHACTKEQADTGIPNVRSCDAGNGCKGTQYHQYDSWEDKNGNESPDDEDLFSCTWSKCTEPISCPPGSTPNISSGNGSPTNPTACNGKLDIGFNVTGITHYGYSDLMGHTKKEDVDTVLSEVQRLGGSVIRVFAANQTIDDAEASKRLGIFLDNAKAKNISVIVSLINFYGDSGFRPKGTESLYSDDYNGLSILGHGFFGLGYKGRYMTFVKKVVNDNKNHTNIYAWEVGNELKDSQNPTTFISFMNDVTATIKSIDKTHPIATGMLNAAHTGLTPSTLYPKLNNIDIITIHTYNKSHDGKEDILWARENNKTPIVEEFGIEGNDRSEILKDELLFWRDMGVEAVLQWAFVPKQITQNNDDGDATLGMDNLWHKDYDSLANVFKASACQKSTSSSVAPTATPTPTPLDPPKNLRASCAVINKALTVTFTWSSVEEAKRYAIRIDKDPGTWGGDNPQEGDTVKNDLTKPSYTRCGNSGTTYKWWVHSVDNRGVYSKEAQGGKVSCTTLTPVPTCEGICEQTYIPTKECSD